MNDFHSRQNYFCPAENLTNLNVLVVGCGAIGRNVASNIGRLGVGSITLVDDDIVEPHNIVPQNWLTSHCGKPKVEVLAKEIADQMVDSIQIRAIPERWTPKVVGKDTEYDAVWTTVDNIGTRKALYNYYRDKCKKFFDIRIGGPMAQIFTISDMEKTDDWYLNTLFDPSEAATFGCVQPMSNYLANIAAGISVGQFVNLMGGKSWPHHKMLIYCAISSSLSVGDPNEYFKD